jgi:hypothetical protein
LPVHIQRYELGGIRPTHLRSNRMEFALAMPRHVMTPGIATLRPDLDHVDELAEAMVMALAR